MEEKSFLIIVYDSENRNQVAGVELALTEDAAIASFNEEYPFFPNVFAIELQLNQLKLLKTTINYALDVFHYGFADEKAVDLLGKPI